MNLIQNVNALAFCALRGIDFLRKRAFLWLILSCLCCFYGVSCKQHPDSTANVSPVKYYSKQRHLYNGISVTVKFSPNNMSLSKKVWRYLEKVDHLFNGFKPDSEISILNRKKTRDNVKISSDLAHAISLSKKLYGLTNGAFDISIGPVINLWKNASSTGIPPSEKDIRLILNRCGLNKVHLSGTAVTFDAPEMELAFYAIAKGIAVDKALRILKQNGATSAFVEVGGEIGAFGLNARGHQTTIGIQHPRLYDKMWSVIVDPGTGVSCATSGNYKKPVTIGGKEYYHIIDPRNGQPVNIRLLSISVVFPTIGRAGLADGLATAGAVIGPAKAIPIIEKLGGQALFLTDEKGKIRQYATSGWKNLEKK